MFVYRMYTVFALFFLFNIHTIQGQDDPAFPDEYDGEGTSESYPDLGPVTDYPDTTEAPDLGEVTDNPNEDTTPAPDLGEVTDYPDEGTTGAPDLGKVTDYPDEGTSETITRKPDIDGGDPYQGGGGAPSFPPNKYPANLLPVKIGMFTVLLLFFYLNILW